MAGGLPRMLMDSVFGTSAAAAGGLRPAGGLCFNVSRNAMRTFIGRTRSRIGGMTARSSTTTRTFLGRARSRTGRIGSTGRGSALSSATFLGRARSRIVLLLLALAAAAAGAARAQPPSAADEGRRVAITPGDAGLLLPLDAFSPQFLGMYRKAMLLEDEIRGHTERYGVDHDLARAVLIQESGGNPGLTSVAGAGGYFQVMPATFRELGVETNVEAGVKYLGQMISQFEREDYAVAAYNGGPGRASGGRPPLETLQYLLSVGDYRNLLKVHESSVRRHAAGIALETVQEGDDWWSLSQRTGRSVLELRMHNPFLATRALQTGQSVAWPLQPRTGLLTRAGGRVEYRTRLGDNYIHLAMVLEVDRDEVREVNDLWHLQTLPPGQVLRLPLAWEGEHEEYVVEEGDDLGTVAERLESTPWRIIRDNGLFRDQSLTPGTVLRVRPEERPRAAAPTATHTVVRGDTLYDLALRYGTTVRAIQDANSMGRRTALQVGQQLVIPTQD